MAELNFTPTDLKGTAHRAGSLAKSLFALYHAERPTRKDARDIATHLQLLRSVLKELRLVLINAEDSVSNTVHIKVKEMLECCQHIFGLLENPLNGPVNATGSNSRQESDANKPLDWNFNKSQISLIKSQLNTVSQTLSLMVSTITLGHQLQDELWHENDEKVSSSVKRSLKTASEHLIGERSSLASLSIVERHFFEAGSPVNQPDTSSSPGTTNDSLRFTQIAEWLSDVVGFNSRAPSIVSYRSTITLSIAQRSIIGDEASHIEVLLERWTNLSDSKSKLSLSEAPRSILDAQNAEPSNHDDNEASDTTTSEEGEFLSYSGYDTPDDSDETVEKNTTKPQSPQIETAHQLSDHPVEETPSISGSECFWTPYASALDSEQTDDQKPAETLEYSSPLENIHRNLDQGAANSIADSSRKESYPPKVETDDEANSSSITEKGGSRPRNDKQQHDPKENITLPNPNASSATEDFEIPLNPMINDRQGPEPPAGEERDGAGVSSENERNFEYQREENNDNMPSWRRLPIPVIHIDEPDDDECQTVVDLKDIESRNNDEISEDKHEISNSGELIVEAEDWIRIQEARINAEEEHTIKPKSEHPCNLDSHIWDTSRHESTLPNREEPRSPESAKIPETTKLLELGNDLVRLSLYPQAALLYRKMYQWAQLNGNQNPGQLRELEFRIAVLFGKEELWASSERLLARIVYEQRVSLEFDSNLAQRTTHYYGWLYYHQKNWKDACFFYRPLWDQRKAYINSVEARSWDVELAIRTGNEYARALIANQSCDSAIRILGITYPAAEEVFGAEDVQTTLYSAVSLAKALRLTGKDDESQKILDITYPKLLAQKRPPRHLIADYQYEISSLALTGGDFEKAETQARSAWQGRKKAIGETDLDTAESAELVSNVLQATGKFDEARRTLTSVRSGLITVYGRDHSRTLRVGVSLAKVLLQLNESPRAMRILQSAYQASLMAGSEVEQERVNIAGELGPLLLIKANEKKTTKERLALKIQAADVLRVLYLGRRKLLGIESTTTLDTGHDYGALCFQLKKYDVAEKILGEVWATRKKVLGEADDRSVSSGFTLGQAFFWNNKELEALATIGSAYDFYVNRLGPLSSQTIDTKEVLGLALISGNPDEKRLKEANDLFVSALEARKVNHGLIPSTFTSALRFALVLLSQAKLSESQALMTWIFDNNTDEHGTYKVGKLFSGAMACLLHYSCQNSTAGNKMVQRIVDYVATVSGKHSAVVRQLQYTQALILFFQRESKGCRRVMRSIWKNEIRRFGSNHKRAISSAEVFATMLIVDSLISKKSITSEAFRVNEWIFERKKGYTSSMQFCLISAHYFSVVGQEEYSKELMRWLYQTNKKLFGRFSSHALSVLAMRYLWPKTPSNNFQDLRATRTRFHDFVPKLWKGFTQGLPNLLEAAWNGNNPTLSKLLRITLPKILSAGFPIWESIKQDRVLGDFDKLRPLWQLMSENNNTAKSIWNLSSIHDFGEFTGPILSQAYSGDPEEIASQVWTIASDESLSDSHANLSDSANNDPSLRATDTLQRQDVDRLNTIGQSIINLANPLEGSNKQAESSLRHLGDGVINETVTEQDIEAARRNIDALEQDLSSLEEP